MHPIAHGAEAILYQDKNRIIKERPAKHYRLPELDERLRKFRTKREAKVLQKLALLQFPAPRLLETAEKTMTIIMEQIPGRKVRDVLLDEKTPANTISFLAEEIGERVGQLHAQQIIHGDLTTSNMILHEKKQQVFFIDFGLSFFSEKVEDKAVDLFLLERALSSTHYLLYPQIFTEVLVSYKKAYTDAAAVLERLEEVRKRGRNKR
ncbi:MAG: KEOPS complex kinase/ATPase Bud32 [Nanoarchaeota archaeon]|nr:KEOPS complex kinase/ATPase Bud32 [Nanoarchaeota archaeon]